MSKKLDVLNRGKFISKLILLVEGIVEKKQGCCFGIDGAWGSGKTFVLEKFEEQLKDIQCEETADNRYYVFHYDCWKYDYYDEPIIAIISAMLDTIENEPKLFSKEIQQVGKLAGKTVKDVLKAIVGELTKNKIGINLVEVANGILEEYDEEKEKNKQFDSLYGFRKALEATRAGIQEIAEYKTVVIVVDELDRCLPTYSIKVLERLHHIFNGLDNVIVIVSMDKSQLEHSINSIYGKINVDTYLRKFISFKVSLDNGEVERYAEKFSEYFSMFDMLDEERDEIEFFLSEILTGLDMRTQERIFNKAKVIHTIAVTDNIRDCSIMTFEMLYLTVSLKMKDKDIQWVCTAWTSARNANVLRRLGESYYNILQKYQSMIYNGATFKGKNEIKDTLIGKTFYWLYVLYKREDVIYLHTDDGRTGIIKRFADLIDIIDVD